MPPYLWNVHKEEVSKVVGSKCDSTLLEPFGFTGV